MEGSIGLLIFIQIVLIFLNAVFACAEIAVLSISEAKLQKLAEQGSRKAKRLQKLTAQPAKFLATIQVAITLSGFLGSALAADNFAEPLTEWLLRLGAAMNPAAMETLMVVLITLILSYLTLVFGELVPKRLAMQKSEQVALGISGLVTFISRLFRPVVWLLSVSTNGVLRLLGIDPNAEEEEAGEEEILLMVDSGSEKGTIDSEEREFIQNVFEFDDLTAGEIITHRTDVTILWMEDTDEQWRDTVYESRHSRFPVCEGSPDHIVGILNAKEYLRLEDKSRAAVMENAVRPAYFVHESIKADVLFRNMKRDRSNLAVVLDEYGGMMGIVTISDLIEELVGEFTTSEEEFDGDVNEVEKLDENTWKIKGNVSLRELEDILDYTFPEREFETFTGLVLSALGSVPSDGKQSIDLTVDRLEIHVSYFKDHQVHRATVKLLPAEEETDE